MHTVLYFVRSFGDIGSSSNNKLTVYSRSRSVHSKYKALKFSDIPSSSLIIDRRHGYDIHLNSSGSLPHDCLCDYGLDGSRSAKFFKRK